MKNSETAKPTDGPIAFQNWQLFEENTPPKHIIEISIFSDAYITGEISSGFGPYELINLVPERTGYGLLNDAILLRYSDHREITFKPATTPPTKKGKIVTDAPNYHGGGLAQEIAALISLFFGIRAQPGWSMRHFDIVGDRFGHPRSRDAQKDPTLRTQFKNPILPKTLGPICLNDFDLLKTLPNLAPRDAHTLVVSARLVQEALWIADSNPTQAWILLVGAIERAANRWCKSKHSPQELLEEFQSDFIEKLREIGNIETVELVAKHMYNIMMSTKKFVSFLSEFCPPPPCTRPEIPRGFLNWNSEDNAKRFKEIYKLRSLVLHTGRELPRALREPPVAAEDGTYYEHPLHLGERVGDSSWFGEDSMPMFLWTFEFIARTSLINWWSHIATQT